MPTPTTVRGEVVRGTVESVRDDAFVLTISDGGRREIEFGRAYRGPRIDATFVGRVISVRLNRGGFAAWIDVESGSSAAGGVPAAAPDSFERRQTEVRRMAAINSAIATLAGAVGVEQVVRLARFYAAIAEGGFDAACAHAVESQVRPTSAAASPASLAQILRRVRALGRELGLDMPAVDALCRESFGGRATVQLTAPELGQLEQRLAARTGRAA